MPVPKPGCMLVYARARSCFCGAVGQTQVFLPASASFMTVIVLFTQRVGETGIVDLQPRC